MDIKLDYFMDGKKLIKVEEEKDLGVIVHKSLKPSAQVAKMVKKANLVLGQLLRAFSYRDKEHFVRLYKVYVRCHLEYAIQSCSPYLKQDIDAIEDVQRRAVRQISGLKGTYEEKLSQIGLTTLVDRRIRGDMIQTFKILNHIDDIPIETFFQVAGADHNHATRGAVVITEEGESTVQQTGMNLVMPRSNLDVRRYYFSQRVISNWNSLPFEVKSAESVNQFKNLYDEHLKSMPFGV